MNVFKCHVQSIGDTTAAVTVEGEVDMATGEQLRACLDDALERNVAQLVIDLTKCGFLDSTGISVLIKTRRRTTLPLHIVAPNEHIRRVLTISSLDSVFSIHPTTAEALGALGQVGQGQGRR
jgi:anti-sigma B factor antagonist